MCIRDSLTNMAHSLPDQVLQKLLFSVGRSRLLASLVNCHWRTQALLCAPDATHCSLREAPKEIITHAAFEFDVVLRDCRGELYHSQFGHPLIECSAAGLEVTTQAERRASGVHTLKCRVVSATQLQGTVVLIVRVDACTVWSQTLQLDLSAARWTLIHPAAQKQLAAQLAEQLCATGGIPVPPMRLSLESTHAAAYLSVLIQDCLLYTSPSPRDRTRSRMPSSA
eukprot:TRINITY_DN9728_c0_g1_i2.p1 TRINITY_DN9728_c0_g1~~TRINITY_DN9728_c0_g1_i2.p1  ORF type:complete len:225 (+),score=37.78 TRINITY_DN9728_c0_g1_i2:104-778(+)